MPNIAHSTCVRHWKRKASAEQILESSRCHALAKCDLNDEGTSKKFSAAYSAGENKMSKF